MGRFKSANVDEMAAELKRLGQITGEMAVEMVRSGSFVIAEQWKETIREKRHVDSGEMLESVAPTQVRQTVGGVAAEIYPQGVDKHGVRNVEKAFLLHYGWKAGTPKRGNKNGKGRKGSYKGDHFVDDIEQNCVEELDEAMRAVLDQYTGGE